MSVNTRRRRGAKGRVMWESTDLSFDRCRCGNLKRKDNALCLLCLLDAQDAYEAQVEQAIAVALLLVAEATAMAMAGRPW
ncbi:MAG TPA: hypothetical protein VJ608_15480 [Albitalea sp.]|nr:hypothetical protein [Albitalea sp.]